MVIGRLSGLPLTDRERVRPLRDCLTTLARSPFALKLLNDVELWTSLDHDGAHDLYAKWPTSVREAYEGLPPLQRSVVWTLPSDARDRYMGFADADRALVQRIPAQLRADAVRLEEDQWRVFRTLEPRHWPAYTSLSDAGRARVATLGFVAAQVCVEFRPESLKREGTRWEPSPKLGRKSEPETLLGLSNGRGELVRTEEHGLAGYTIRVHIDSDLLRAPWTDVRHAEPAWGVQLKHLWQIPLRVEGDSRGNVEPRDAQCFSLFLPPGEYAVSVSIHHDPPAAGETLVERGDGSAGATWSLGRDADARFVMHGRR
jgi:hypothetical protein